MLIPPDTDGGWCGTGQHRRIGIGLEERAPMPDVKDNPAMSRFEMPSGGAVGFVEHERAGDGRIALHT
jgi:hypothetical protein